MIVLYVVSTLKRCGPTNQLFGIVKNLDRSRFTPIVLTLSPEPAESRRQDFMAMGVELRSLELGRLAGMAAGKRKLQQQLRTIAPAIVHTQGIRADTLCAQVLDSKVPHVATLRNYPFKDYVMTYGRIRGAIMAYWHLHALQKASAVALVSKAIGNMLGQALRNTRVVQNGVDIERYFPVPQLEKAHLRSRLGLPDGSRIFISTGHLDPRKDPSTAIEGFVSGTRKSDMLIVLGDGSERKELETRFGGKGHQIRFPGRVANVQEYLQASDYFISASLAEGLPNAVLEALACGLPCVLSDIAEHAEIVTASPLEKFQFRRSSRDSLAALLRNLNDADYSELSEASVELAKNGFSAASMSGQYQAIYQELTS